MNEFDQMIMDGRFEEFERLVKACEATLEYLSEEMFQRFKVWIEDRRFCGHGTLHAKMVCGGRTL
jgi:hypothetical protein